MTRYWALRTDQQRRPFFWSELQAGRLRQGWGYRPDLDLEHLAHQKREGATLPKFQQDAWRGNRRLLPSQPDGMQVGDIVVLLHLPRYGVWSVARVTGSYRYEISTMGNAVDGTPDYGHIRDVELLTDERGIDPISEGVSDRLRHAMRPMIRMWSLDAHGAEMNDCFADDLCLTLILHSRPVETFFDLLGRNENDMTAALGLGLTRSAPLLPRFVERLTPGAAIEKPVVVELQEHDETGRGFTDIEIRTPDLHVIVEAKRGWDPPSEAQLRRYEARFASGSRLRQRVVILTQNGADAVVRHRLGEWAPADPIGVGVLGWSDVAKMARAASHEGRLAHRHLAQELASYLREVADMRDTDSNRVFVVALGATPWAGWPNDLTPIAIVERFNRYSFPATGKNYPKTPPNYIAFRYWGKLPSIHHVDDYTIVDQPLPHIPGAPDLDWEQPNFMLTLGLGIRPNHEVRTGSGIVRSGRVWVDIDLLLTSSTITEAAERSRARRTG